MRDNLLLASWRAFIAVQPRRGSGYEDDAWRRFKREHGFNPKDFESSPPWCEAGVRNNEWARRAFEGDVHRRRAWSMAGYFDRPFHFAYLWLDFAGFSGLRGGNLPYTARHTRTEMKREAQRLARLVDRLNKELAKWPFRGVLDMKSLVKPTDYGNSVTLPASPRFTPEHQHIATQVMFAGARQELNLPATGQHSVMARMAEALRAWQPPPTLIERPRVKNARSRLASRWLDREVFPTLGGDIPAPAKHILIAELVAVLSELGGWREEVWTEEMVRRSLGTKSPKKK